MTGNRKAHFLIFLCFCLFFHLFCFLLLFWFFKGQVRWPEGPPHLALNPPSFFDFFGFVCVFLEGLRVRWGGHLALNPPYFFLCLFFVVCYVCLFFCCFSFLSLLLSEKKPVFPLKNGIFCLFLSVSLCFSWAFFGLPLVQALFLCLSLVFFFLSSFLSFFFAFFWFLLLLSFSLFLSSLLLFHEKSQHQNIKLQCFFVNPVSFLVFCRVFSLKSLFSYFCFLADFQLSSLLNISVFGFKKTQVEKHQFGSKGGLQQNVFFNNLCFAKCEKLSFCLTLSWPIFVDVQKQYKPGISAHFEK